MSARPVLTICPNTGNEIATHALMTEHQLARFRGELSLYCSACGEAHLVERAKLYLQGRRPALPQPEDQRRHDRPEDDANPYGRQPYKDAADVWRV